MSRRTLLSETAGGGASVSKGCWTSLFGILAGIAETLAENGISIFAISTYNTDYVLVKKESYQRALDILEQEGYKIVE